MLRSTDRLFDRNRDGELDFAEQFEKYEFIEEGVRNMYGSDDHDDDDFDSDPFGDDLDSDGDDF